ncbi:immunity protein YezG family protein [Ningiella sp. W23]|uniref:immunity protein YezG family protein n=1 Tax=Ningiella sp. W23 TaxID=3023715 RepID=UPI0037581A99
MTFDQLNEVIAKNMISNSEIKSFESCSLDIEYYGDDAMKFSGGYTCDDKSFKSFKSFKFRKFDDNIMEVVDELHKVTTENPDNNWNRAKFTLFPDGEFSIDFKWDQDLADEIERLSNED